MTSGDRDRTKRKPPVELAGLVDLSYSGVLQELRSPLRPDMILIFLPESGGFIPQSAALLFSTDIRIVERNPLPEHNFL